MWSVTISGKGNSVQQAQYQMDQQVQAVIAQHHLQQQHQGNGSGYNNMGNQGAMRYQSNSSPVTVFNTAPSSGRSTPTSSHFYLPQHMSMSSGKHNRGSFSSMGSMEDIYGYCLPNEL